LRRRLADPETAQGNQYSLLARFIFQDSHFRKKPPAKPKPNAFLPNPSSLKTSAIWRDALPDQDIWDIGDLLGRPRSKAPLARADFDIATVSEAKLTIESDPIPHARHINLCGWPTAKDEQKDVALVLCARSILIIR
jgi:hypothetical protein